MVVQPCTSRLPVITMRARTVILVTLAGGALLCGGRVLGSLVPHDAKPVVAEHTQVETISINCSKAYADESEYQECVKRGVARVAILRQMHDVQNMSEAGQ